jgi:hypothetical protein
MATKLNGNLKWIVSTIVILGAIWAFSEVVIGFHDSAAQAHPSICDRVTKLETQNRQILDAVKVLQDSQDSNMNLIIKELRELNKVVQP